MANRLLDSPEEHFPFESPLFRLGIAVLARLPLQDSAHEQVDLAAQLPRCEESLLRKAHLSTNGIASPLVCYLTGKKGSKCVAAPASERSFDSITRTHSCDTRWNIGLILTWSVHDRRPE